MIDVTWDAKLESPNVSNDWGRFKRSRCTKKERNRARLELANAIQRHGQRPRLPVVVTITRFGPRKLDGDNVQRSAKHVRDGIADILGVNDGDESAATWQYRQEYSRKYQVRVQVEAANGIR